MRALRKTFKSNERCTTILGNAYLIRLATRSVPKSNRSCSEISEYGATALITLECFSKRTQPTASWVNKPACLGMVPQEPTASVVKKPGRVEMAPQEPTDGAGRAPLCWYHSCVASEAPGVAGKKK